MSTTPDCYLRTIGKTPEVSLLPQYSMPAGTIKAEKPITDRTASGYGERLMHTLDVFDFDENYLREIFLADRTQAAQIVAFCEAVLPKMGSVRQALYHEEVLFDAGTKIPGIDDRDPCEINLEEEELSSLRQVVAFLKKEKAHIHAGSHFELWLENLSRTLESEEGNVSIDILSNTTYDLNDNILVIESLQKVAREALQAPEAPTFSFEADEEDEESCITPDKAKMLTEILDTFGVVIPFPTETLPHYSPENLDGRYSVGLHYCAIFKDGQVIGIPRSESLLLDSKNLSPEAKQTLETIRPYPGYASGQGITDILDGLGFQLLRDNIEQDESFEEFGLSAKTHYPDVLRATNYKSVSAVMKALKTHDLGMALETLRNHTYRDVPEMLQAKRAKIDGEFEDLLAQAKRELRN